MKKMVLLLFMIGSITQAMAQLTWSPPVNLSASLVVNSSDPQVIMDAKGNVTAVWVENGFIQASFLPVNGSWGAPVAISGSGSSSPALGVDGNGNVTAVWIASNSTVKLATLPFNGNWSAASTVSSSGASAPALAVDATGNIALVWVRGGFIEASTKLLGGLLSLVSTISPANSNNPDISIGANGRVVAVWHTVLGTGADTVEGATQGGIGGTWTSAVNILPAPSAFSHNYPKVSVDLNGNADVIWYRYLLSGGAYSNVFVYSATLPGNSSSWSFPVQISDTGTGNPSELFMAINTDATGNKIGIWSLSFDGQSFDIQSSLKAPGAAWSPVSSIQTSNIYALQGTISTDQLGNATTAYMLFDGTSVGIGVREASSAGIGGQPIWTPPTTVSTGMDNGYPVIAAKYSAVDQTTYAAAVWLTSDGAHTTVQAATGFKIPIQPVSNVTVVQNVNDFGVFKDYYNTISWDASPHNDVVEYGIYRNGVLVAQVGASTLEFIDHHAVQNGSVTYGIAAIDAEFFLSQIMTASFH